MRSRWGILSAALGLIALVAVANAVRQRVFVHTPEPEDSIVFTEWYVLTDTLDSDLVVMAQSVSLEDESRVTGDAALMAREVSIEGTISGDLTVVGEHFTLDEDARLSGDVMLLVDQVELNGRIDGDVTIMGGNLVVGENAVVVGDFGACTDAVTDGREDARPIHDCVNTDELENLQSLQFAQRNAPLSLELGSDNPEAPNSFGLLISPPESDSTLRLEFNPPDEMEMPSLLLPILAGSIFGPESGIASASMILPLLAATTSVNVQDDSPADFALLGLLMSVLGSLMLTGLAALAVTFFPRQIDHIEGAIRSIPRNVSGVGIMLLVLAIGVTGAICLLIAVLPPVGLILLPVYLIAALLLLGMMIAGWITLGLVFGGWLLKRVAKATLPPLVTVCVGTFTLFTIVDLLALLPYGEVLALIAVVLIGSVGLGAALITRMGTRPLRHMRLAR